MIFEDLTIIIPTYNRTNFIRRSFNYWKSSGINFIIRDSSPKINNELKNYKNYTYKKDEQFFEKIYNTINEVKTKYALIVADDDIVFPETIYECLIYLNKNSNFVSAQGAFMDFWYNKNNDIDICVRNPSISAKNSNLFEDEVSERINKSMQHYFQHIDAIHRTEVLQKAFEISKNINNDRAAEINITLIGSIYGKHKMIESLYCCRQVVSINKIVPYNKESYYQWLQNDKNIKYVEEWISSLSHVLSTLHNISKNKANFMINNAIYSYGKRKNNFFDIFKNILSIIIPKKFINKFRHPLYYKKSWPPTSEEAKKIRSLSISEKYYPWSNTSANDKWKKIKIFLMEYGKVEDNSYT